mgnify:CR=1 FL=1
MKKCIITKNSVNKIIPIFFGSTTLFEGLEIYSEVIHICSDPAFEGLDSSFWQNINVEKISDNVFKYRLLKHGEYIIFGNKTAKKNFVNKL